MLKWIVVAVLALAVLVAVAAIIGLCIPKSHRASRTIVYAVPPDVVFAQITAFERFPEWRRGVKAVELLPAGDGIVRFKEVGPHGPVTYRVEARDPNTRLVTRIDDPSQPFGGSWTMTLKPVAVGTELTIVEDGEIYNPIFRLVAAAFFSASDTIDAYQADLGRRLEQAHVRRPGGSS